MPNNIKISFFSTLALSEEYIALAKQIYDTTVITCEPYQKAHDPRRVDDRLATLTSFAQCFQLTLFNDHVVLSADGNGIPELAMIFVGICATTMNLSGNWALSWSYQNIIDNNPFYGGGAGAIALSTGQITQFDPPCFPDPLLGTHVEILDADRVRVGVRYDKTKRELISNNITVLYLER